MENLPPPIHFRLATDTDAPALAALCARWHRDRVTTNQRGFLGAIFTEETFRQLIGEGHCAAADINGQIIGYYACNPFTKDGVLALHQSKVALCQQAGLVPEEARIGIGCQALVDAPFQGQGIRERLLHRLVAQLSGHYDYLFGTISKENPRAFRAHTKDGWQVMQEDEQYWSVFFPLPPQT